MNRWSRQQGFYTLRSLLLRLFLMFFITGRRYNSKSITVFVFCSSIRQQ